MIDITALHGDGLLEFFRGSMSALVRLERRDLSNRQLAAFLICYGEDEPQTVQGAVRKAED